MSKHVVVVGSGLGGLSAAVACAQKGCTVSLFETHSQTGGYATSFARSGFTFDPALHAVPAGGDNAPFAMLMEELGIADRIRFLPITQGFCARFGSSTYHLAPPYDKVFDDLSDTFPTEKNGLQRLRKEISTLGSLFYHTVEGNLSSFAIATRFVPKLPSFLNLAGISTLAYLSRFVKTPALRSLLFHPALFYGIPMAEFPAVNFIIMFYLLCTKGMFTIAGGGRTLSAALSDRLISLGGRIATSTEVAKIRIANKRAAGVELVNGDVVDADAVICNANARVMVESLVGKEQFSSHYLQTLANLKSSISVVQLHLGLDCPLSAVGITDHITTLFPDADIDRILRMRNTDLVPSGYSIIAPSATDPLAAPQGKSVLSVLGGVSSSKWIDLSKSEYKDAKKKCTDELLEDLDKWYPALPSHCSVVDCATPRTFQRYTGNPDGAILGFDCSLGTQRNIMRISKLPIANLHIANAWTGRLGGFMQAVKAGVVAAKHCMKSGSN